MNTRLAIIDLGTNTFHLLLAQREQQGYSIIHREKVAVRVGVGGINQDMIQEEAISRAIETLRKFKHTIERSTTTQIHAFGTSALRNAINGREVINQIKKETGIDITLISGDQEAEFIYYGVRSALDLGHTNSLIMDIGGGSVEFIIANQQRIHWKQSIEIGGQRLLEKFQDHDPITPDEIARLDQYLNSSLQKLMDAVHQYNPLTLVGSSGTFDTLSDIHCLKYAFTKSENDSEAPLTIPSFYEIYNQLISKSRIERMQIPGMIEMRVDMIVVTCCLIRFMLENHTFEKIRVSGYSLKEGVLASLSLKD
jgi:exopolyphosphatase/guanosine-5'-triphosphate,3'-diphosphate pyrophosphatase